MTQSDEIVAIARTWIGTPYHHQAGLKGIGCDCLGLVRGVYGEVMGEEPEAPPPYTPDWAEATGRETLIEAAARHLEPVSKGEALPGDILIFRFTPSSMAKHAGILVTPERMVHAYSGRAVVEVHLGPWWQRRLAACFRFPGVTA